MFLLFACMNYVSNQNGRVMKEMLAGFNIDDVKTTLRRLRYFKMTLPILQVLYSLCYFVTHNESVTNSSVD